jgi:fatty acid desaturase
LTELKKDRDKVKEVISEVHNPHQKALAIAITFVGFVGVQAILALLNVPWGWYIPLWIIFFSTWATMHDSL